LDLVLLPRRALGDFDLDLDFLLGRDFFSRGERDLVRFLGFRSLERESEGLRLLTRRSRSRDRDLDFRRRGDFFRGFRSLSLDRDLDRDFSLLLLLRGTAVASSTLVFPPLTCPLPTRRDLDSETFEWNRADWGGGGSVEQEYSAGA